MKVSQVIIVSIISIVILFIITKLAGNKQLSQLNAFDYVVGITIGSIAAEMATDLEDPIQPGVAMLVYGIFAVSINFITSKSNKIRQFISGKPLILMSHDKIYRNRLSEARLDINEFLAMARLAGYFDISQIETAVFEHNGNISFLPKTQHRPATPDDMKLPIQKEHQFINIIVDGKIMYEELGHMGKDEQWLKDALRLQGCEKISDIFLGMLDPNGVAYFYPIENKKN